MATGESVDRFGAEEASGGTPPAASSWDTRTKILSELADIDGHVAFAKGLLARNALPEDARSDVERAIGRVEARQQDPCVTMAVIGEFSAGKSSFINALLREELFETDAVQGTTVASTIIGYGAAPELRLETTGQSQESTPQIIGTQDDLAGALAKYTSGSEGSVGTQTLLLAYPSDFLSEDVRIIDTPGTNSLSQWHDEVTKRTLRDTADACIVLTPAVEPFSQTLRDFMRDNLSEMLPSCLFVLTKIDLVRERERGRVLEHARRILASEFGLENPVILPYCSLPEAEGFEEANRASERRMIEALRERRVRIQLQRCGALLDQALTALGQNMAHLAEERRLESERLAEATTRDLSSFIREKREIVLRDFQQKIGRESESFRSTVHQLASEEYLGVWAMLNSCASLSHIRHFLSQGLESVLSGAMSRIVVRLETEEPGARTLNMVRLIAQGERLRFEHEFLSEYQTLTSLTQDLNIPVSISFVHESRWFSEGSPQAGPSQDASESSAWTGRSGQGGSAFGMGTGAIAGVPVPSTDHLVKLTEKGISARLGLNQDSSNPEQVRRVKEEVSPGLAELATSFFSAVEAELNRSFISYANEAWAALDHLLTEYRAEYGHAIAEMRERDLTEQIRVDDELESIRLDHRLVEGHLKVLRVTLKRLREI